jgi:hypothetical protein
MTENTGTAAIITAASGPAWEGFVEAQRQAQGDAWHEVKEGTRLLNQRDQWVFLANLDPADTLVDNDGRAYPYQAAPDGTLFAVLVGPRLGGILNAYRLEVGPLRGPWQVLGRVAEPLELRVGGRKWTLVRVVADSLYAVGQVAVLHDPDGGYDVPGQQEAGLDLTTLRSILEVPPGADARTVAALFYRLMEEDHLALWRQTLTADNRDWYERAGNPYRWWEAGRKYVERYGVHYEFDHLRGNLPNNDEEANFFFQRYHQDGTKRGNPVPISLVREEGEWRVYSASM